MSFSSELPLFLWVSFPAPFSSPGLEYAVIVWGNYITPWKGVNEYAEAVNPICGQIQVVDRHYLHSHGKLFNFFTLTAGGLSIMQKKKREIKYIFVFYIHKSSHLLEFII